VVVHKVTGGKDVGFLITLAGVRKKVISPWLAFAIICLAAAITGVYYVHSQGDDLIGALCLSPLLAFAFGMPALMFAFILKPKE
jgi:hypothetical protein